MYLRMYAAKSGVDVHRASMIGRRCPDNATDMQCRFTSFCDVLTTRSECRWLKQLEDQRRRALVKQCRFTQCCNVLAMPMPLICSVVSHHAAPCLPPEGQQMQPHKKIMLRSFARVCVLQTVAQAQPTSYTGIASTNNQLDR